ncbi:MAG: hypothetical protein AAGE52_19335 [Myxococcota bacterium]
MRFLLLACALSFGLACGGPDPDETSASLEPDDSTGSEVGEPADPPAEDPPAAAEGELVVGEDACETDADCVPAECCHAAACVGTANAPSCDDAMCTMDCQYGTLDCGGRCLCHEGRCAARLSARPELEVNGEPVGPQ